jgi:hypothetical protein
LIPDTLRDAANKAAGDLTVKHIAVWEECGLEDETLVRLPKAAEGVCAAVVERDRNGDEIIPFLWREDLAGEEIVLAEALFKIGIGKEALEAAAALRGGV